MAPQQRLVERDERGSETVIHDISTLKDGDLVSCVKTGCGTGPMLAEIYVNYGELWVRPYGIRFGERWKMPLHHFPISSYAPMRIIANRNQPFKEICLAWNLYICGLNVAEWICLVVHPEDITVEEMRASNARR